MREDQVPQEGNSTLAGQRKVVYASRDSGDIGIARSRGWEAEEIVTRQAVEEFERLQAEARERALGGVISPLEYHMYKARMDFALLAQTSGMWRWRIRRHFRPDVFNRLPERTLRRYAEALGLTTEQLRKVD